MKKINFISARKLFDAGHPVIIIPKNVSPFSSLFANTYLKTDPTDDFKKICNAISFYNCNKELGKTLAYYNPESGT